MGPEDELRDLPASPYFRERSRERADEFRSRLNAWDRCSAPSRDFHELYEELLDQEEAAGLGRDIDRIRVGFVRMAVKRGLVQTAERIQSDIMIPEQRIHALRHLHIRAESGYFSKAMGIIKTQPKPEQARLLDRLQEYADDDGRKDWSAFIEETRADVEQELANPLEPPYYGD